MTIEKKREVTLDEALTIAGSGRYTYFVILTSGLIGMSAMMTLQAMSVVMPVTGCELHLSDATRGMITSMCFTGMLFSAQIFGFLADTFGRKKVMVYCQLATLVVITLWSLAPDTISLGVIVFVNGLILTGLLTPVYVFLGEYCDSNFRPKAILIMSGLTAIANIYLPGMAWIILPLDVYVPIFGLIVFSSWRLYILLLAVPVLLSLLLLTKIPETPKFLLGQGKQEETLEVLKTIFAINNGKPREEFPVSNISLDQGDEVSSNEEKGNQFFIYLKKIIKQIVTLFSKQYFVFTIISCLVLFGLTGTCNTFVLWFSEVTSRIRNYSLSKGNFNVTVCDLMGKRTTHHSGQCQIDYDFLSAGILLGIAEIVACFVVGLFARKMNKKIFLACSAFLTAGLCFGGVFVKEEYTIMTSFSVIIVVLFVVFPVMVSIIVDVFPTQLRSTAASVTVTCARLGSALGSQIMGVLYENHCTTGYFGITAILVTSGILCILIPANKKVG